MLLTSEVLEENIFYQTSHILSGLFHNHSIYKKFTTHVCQRDTITFYVRSIVRVDK